jgi:DNA-binding CsgD family transcriptional regulator/tetratricopeptide (TPR) repeat protein
VRRSDVLEVLTNLVDQSLVLAEAGTGEMRYRLLEPVRQYAQQRLVPSGARWEAMRRRHAEYWLAVGEQGAEGLMGPEEVVWDDRLEREHDNLGAALRRCIDSGEVEIALRLASVLWKFWRTRGYRNEGIRWLEEGLARIDSAVVPRVRATALQRAADLAYAYSDYRGARARFEEVLSLHRRLGDLAGTATVLSRLGRLLARSGQVPSDLERAQAALHESLRLFRQLDDTSGMGWALMYVGASAYEQGQLDQAEQALVESVALFQHRGERHMRAHAQQARGLVALERNDAAHAERLQEEVLPIMREFGCGEGFAGALYGLARAAHARGDDVRARDVCLEAVLLYQRVGVLHDLTACLELLAGLAVCTQPAHAAFVFAAAEAQRRAMGATLPAVDRARRERAVAIARGALGRARFVAATVAGRAAPLSEVVERVRNVAATLTVPRAPGALSDPLTRREREVATLVARGLTNRQIAESLVISERTVDTHVANIFSKLELKTRAQVAVWCVGHPLARTHG